MLPAGTQSLPSIKTIPNGYVRVVASASLLDYVLTARDPNKAKQTLGPKIQHFQISGLEEALAVRNALVHPRPIDNSQSKSQIGEREAYEAAELFLNTISDNLRFLSPGVRDD